VAVAGTLPVLLVAGWDYARPPDRRTHIGRFVAQLVHGDAGAVLARKQAANLAQLVQSPFLVLAVGSVIVTAFAMQRHRPWLTRMARSTPGLIPAVTSITLCALIGTVLNDSGVTVAGIMLSVALPTVAALALRADPTDAQ
jgi:hypothetical protein